MVQCTRDTQIGDGAVHAFPVDSGLPPTLLQACVLMRILMHAGLAMCKCNPCSCTGGQPSALALHSSGTRCNALAGACNHILQAFRRLCWRRHILRPAADSWRHHPGARDHGSRCHRHAVIPDNMLQTQACPRSSHFAEASHRDCDPPCTVRSPVHLEACNVRASCIPCPFCRLMRLLPSMQLGTLACSRFSVLTAD